MSSSTGLAASPDIGRETTTNNESLARLRGRNRASLSICSVLRAVNHDGIAVERHQLRKGLFLKLVAPIKHELGRPRHRSGFDQNRWIMTVMGDHRALLGDVTTLGRDVGNVMASGHVFGGYNRRSRPARRPDFAGMIRLVDPTNRDRTLNEIRTRYRRPT